ncbi:ATP-binding cassette domain-containing protein [Bacillus safensis]|uniref:ATP-binding cassette domain-containing protein n=2 Tax=Bacillus TaxID=1386 RepID=UPI001F49D54D|nr:MULTISPECIES: ATP-binding cassette domain-containing protein [Bacillus]MDJ0292143.1 ATP-binding cassette domain-containing protein [Bacillus safensis]MED4992813.1 ATP-binding cassette domain-containing protein [Bacillus safensis]
MGNMILKDITVSFGPTGEENIVLAALNYTVNEGIVQGIIGSSSSGKSTLARIMIGEIAPLTGEIVNTKKGKSIGLLSKRRKRRLSLITFKRRGKCFSAIERIKSNPPQILIIDDIEDFDFNKLSELLYNRRANCFTTILLSNNFMILKKHTSNIVYLENGKINV